MWKNVLTAFLCYLICFLISFQEIIYGSKSLPMKYKLFRLNNLLNDIIAD